MRHRSGRLFSMCRWSSAFISAAVASMAASAPCVGADIFLRARVLEPPALSYSITTGGWRHTAEPSWYLPAKSFETVGTQWSPWVDLTDLPLHGRLDRAGGVAEWPAMSLSVEAQGADPGSRGCTLEVQLADRPDENAVVVTFTEASQSRTIGFLLPHPLREKRGEFETGTQMAARHRQWAVEASGFPADAPPPAWKHMDLITSLWGPYDPALARSWARTLRLLGFNVVGGLPVDILQEEGLRTYTATWHLGADPEESAETWNQGEGARILQELQTPEGRWSYDHMAHYVVSDEIQTMDLRPPGVDAQMLNRWFRAYLRSIGQTDQSMGQAMEGISYPAAELHQASLARESDLNTRKVLYHAARFGQWWSVKRLRQTTDLIRGTFAQAVPPIHMKTETLPSDHAFFNAWGPPKVGMAALNLDLFEIGRQEAVDIVSAEDWMGLNHMYGPNYTWTGAQSLEYLAAILRSGVGDRPVALRALITPSDDGYLRLKAYSCLGQGATSFFFWTFGPTFIGTENYWGDLRSEYNGIAKLSKALRQAEDVLATARPVRDPVAVLYSVSSDIWHCDQPAPFVEKRLLWHALRHLHVQPDFLCEEEVAAGALKDYQVLYVVDWCVSRSASAAIEQWVQDGGVVYLSAGAATRDEYYEPYVPPYARKVWPADASSQLVAQKHQYNERVDLPGIAPLTCAELLTNIETTTQADRRVKVIGCRQELRLGLEEASIIGRFDDGRPAMAMVAHGGGTVFGLGLLPALAYAPFQTGQTTLNESWPEWPRFVIGAPLRAADVRAVADCRTDVVETSLLSGPRGSALVLVNYTYQPVAELVVDLRFNQPIARARSTEGVAVKIEKTRDGYRLALPLTWTDIVLLTEQ